MEFNNLVKSQLFPILLKEGFEIAEEFKNILRFQSSVMKVNVVFNEYERSFFIEIGKQNDTLFPLNDHDIKEFFKTSLSIEQVSVETFLQNISTLFKTKVGNSLLKGNCEDFIKFKTLEDNNYTFELVQRQILETASKAWERNDYKTFIKSINEIDIEKIPLSYLLKYKIAKQKLLK